MEAGKICLTILLPENNNTMLPFGQEYLDWDLNL